MLDEAVVVGERGFGDEIHSRHSKIGMSPSDSCVKLYPCRGRGGGGRGSTGRGPDGGRTRCHGQSSPATIRCCGEGDAAMGSARPRMRENLGMCSVDGVRVVRLQVGAAVEVADGDGDGVGDRVGVGVEVEVDRVRP